jgi:hypothetical protein
MTPTLATFASSEASKTISALCATAPKTLTGANDMLNVIAEQAISFSSTPHADIGEKIRAMAGVGADNPLPKTLPQARVRLSEIAALLPSSGSTAAPVAKISAGRAVRDAERAALSLPEETATLAKIAAAGSDAPIWDRYLSLKGNDRQTYFSANREALIRENARRTDAAATALHGDVVGQYMSLTGQARSDFYDKHHRELFEAHRAQSKHGR